MYILGINAYHGNASAAIIADGRLVAAVEEERFNRVKYAAGFPAAAIRYCLETAGITLREVNHIAIPRNPWARLGTKLFYALRMPSFATERAKVLTQFVGIPEALAKAFDVSPDSIRAKFHRVEHHQAHLASTFFVSPFDQAALLSADGLGDFASTMWGVGRGNQMQIDGAIAFPHSLGLYYTAMSQYLGFRKFGDEYKVMGLAAYGEPAYMDEYRRIVRNTRGIGFRLGLKYFKHHRTGPEMTWRDSDKTPELGAMYSDYMAKRLGPARDPAAPVEKKHRDGAASLQARLEEVLFQMLRGLHARTKQKAVCLAGGVAFNCVANGKIVDQTPFEKIFVQPAAGDAGLAIGAAYYVHHQILGLPRTFVMENAYWGPGYTHEKIGAAIKASPLQGEGLEISELHEKAIAIEAAREVADGKILGWFQGPRRMGTARPGQSQHCGRPSSEGYEGNSERQNQAPGNVPALCSFDSRGVHGRIFREVRSGPVHDQSLFRTTGKARRYSRAHARRWNRPPANRYVCGKPALLAADSRVCEPNRRAGCAEHVVQ